MKVSKNLLTTSYNVPESHFFATREERNTYFMTNSYGDYALCAINSTGESVENTDPDAAVWDLELFNGINWVLQSVDTNYAMVITNEGLKALAYVNESQGGYKIRISGIKCKSTHIIFLLHNGRMKYFLVTMMLFWTLLREKMRLLQ